MDSNKMARPRSGERDVSLKGDLHRSSLTDSPEISDDETKKADPLDSPTGLAVLNDEDGSGSSIDLQEKGTGAVVLPGRVKVPALVLVIFFTRESFLALSNPQAEIKTLPSSVGSNYTQSSLSPLKSTIRKQVPGVTNAKYGVISSSDQLINGVLPIFSGIIIDYYGPSFGSLVSSSFILLGAIVRAIGGQKASFPM